MTRLTVIVLTYNNAEIIARCLESTQFADSVIVFDSFSTDATVEIAWKAGAQTIQRKFDHYAGQRNAALEAVRGKTDWVLFVDSDEQITPELAAESRRVIEVPGYAGWRIPRWNMIFGRLTRGAGWYPDYQTRLLKVGAAKYDPERIVHEVTLLDEAEGTMQEHLIHHNYRDVRHFMEKQQRYAQMDAAILQEQGIRPKPQNYLLQPVRQFRWRFFQLKGYRDGIHGFRLCLLMAYYEFYKYWRLRKLWKRRA